MQTPARWWPMNLAVLSLVLLALAIPLIAFVMAISATFTLGGSTVSEAAQTRAFQSTIVGAISAALGVVGGLVAIFAGRGVGVRVVAAFAILIGLGTGLVHTWFAYSYVRAHTPTTSQQDDGPSCGIGSHPAVFGPESRNTACPEDLAAANQFLDQALPQLPTEDVTVESVEAAAKKIDPTAYVYTSAFDDGSITVGWVPAEVTCATATWFDGQWTTKTQGSLADGGC